MKQYLIHNISGVAKIVLWGQNADHSVKKKSKLHK